MKNDLLIINSNRKNNTSYNVIEPGIFCANETIAKSLPCCIWASWTLPTTSSPFALLTWRVSISDTA